MDDLPFADCIEETVPYGSLHRVAPYVSSPVSSLVRAIELAEMTRPPSQLDDVLELGCGRGEFIRQVHAAGWLKRNITFRKAQRCRGIDILEKELKIAREWAESVALEDERKCSNLLLEDNKLQVLLPPVLVEFINADIFHDDGWSRDSSLIFIYLVPRMLTKLDEILARCCSKKGVRVITFCYHFAEDSGMHNDYLYFSDNLLNLRLYCSRADTTPMLNIG